MHSVYLVKALVNKLLNRDKRAAILFTSSAVARYLFSGNISYGASSAMVTNFGESIYYELR